MIDSAKSIYFGESIFVDACVFFKVQSTDLLMWSCLHDLIKARWSNDVDNEWISNVVKKGKTTKEKAIRRANLMHKAVNDWEVSGYQSINISKPLPDVDDVHVLQACIHGKCNWILTFNLKDFPNSITKEYGIYAIHPDDFFNDLATHKSEDFYDAVSDSFHNFDPHLSEQEYLDRLVSAELVETAKTLKKSFFR